MRLRFARYIAAVFIFCTLFSPLPAYAQTDVLADPCADPAVAQESATCQSRTKDNPLTGTDGMLFKVSLVLAVIAGITAVIMIIVSGLKYITSGGDAQKTTAARNTLIGSIVGLVIIVLAQTIITFVVSRIN